MEPNKLRWSTAAVTTSAPFVFTAVSDAADFQRPAPWLATLGGNGFAFYCVIPNRGIGALRSLPLLQTMAAKFSLALEITGKSPSILAADVGQDELDLHDAWNERATCRWRVASPDKKVTSWSSRLTSLSSNLRDAGGALTTRAKQLRVREATHRAISQLRKSMVETSSSKRSLSRAASMPAQHVFSESDVDPLEPDAEDDGIEDCKNPPRLHPSHSWTQGSI